MFGVVTLLSDMCYEFQKYLILNLFITVNVISLELQYNTIACLYFEEKKKESHF